MKALLVLLIMPLVILNFIGGLVGGIWLAVEGEWSLIGMGLLYAFAGAFLIGLLLFPAMLLSAPGIMVSERHPIFGAVLAVPGLVWTYAVMAATCIGAFSYVVRDMQGSAIPYLLWAYSMALAPWSFLASKEDRDSSAGVSVFFAQLGTLAMMIAVLRNPFDVSIDRLAWWFVPFLLVGLVVQLFFAAALMAEESRRRRYLENY
jgi:hypothetical protein